MMLYDKLKSFRILLASRSARRQYLLKELGISFQLVLPTDENETYPDYLQDQDIAMFIAKAKAEGLKPKMLPSDIIITADTIVVRDKKVLGKPIDRKEAIEMIEQLSGHCHEVFTGVCLTSVEKQSIFFSLTQVYFRNLSKEEIEFYIDTCKPYDKAGAYGAQEWIGYTAIEKIEGSYFNVMGLPVDKLWRELGKFIEI